MAITTQFCTGFEYGVITATPSGSIIDQVTSSPTAVTANVRSGTYSLQCAAVASAVSVDKQTNLPTGALVERFGFRNSVRPSADASIIAVNRVNGQTCNITLDIDGTLKCLWVGGGGAQTIGVVPLSTWVCIELQVNSSATTYTCVGRLNGGTQSTSATLAGQVAGAAFQGVALGSIASTFTYTCQYDDWILGTYTVAATDWYGDGQVLALLPGSDGTHSIAGNQFSFGDAGAAFSSTSTAWTMVDDAAPWTTTRSTTDNLAQRIAGANYLEIAPVAAPKLAVKANAVNSLLAYSASSATADTGGCVVRNSAGASVTVYGFTGALTDYSETSNFFKCAMATVPAAGWTPAEVNLIRWRCGFSDDINPVPTWQALMLEVDWPMARRVLARKVVGSSPSIGGIYT